MSIIEKIDLLIDVFEAVKKNDTDDKHLFAIIKLRHLKSELIELEKNNPNDSLLGAEIRKLLKE